MLRTFIFDQVENNWVEDDEFLFYHDLCVFLDEENQVIYLWKGPKTTRKQYKKAYASLNELIPKPSQQEFQINVLAKYVPNQIQDKLDKMLTAAKKEEEIGKYIFSKIITIRLYLLLLLTTIIMPILSILMLSFCFTWPVSDGLTIVSSVIYHNWLIYPQILILISLVCFILIILIGLYEKEVQVITFSLMGLIICIGISFYLQQGIYLFLFQEGSTSNIFIIDIKELFLFFILISSAIFIFELPNIIKFVTFIRDYRKFIF